MIFFRDWDIFGHHIFLLASILCFPMIVIFLHLFFVSGKWFFFGRGHFIGIFFASMNTGPSNLGSSLTNISTTSTLLSSFLALIAPTFSCFSYHEHTNSFSNKWDIAQKLVQCLWHWYMWFLVLILFLMFFLLSKSRFIFGTLGDISWAFDLQIENYLYRMKGISELFLMMVFSLLDYVPGIVIIIIIIFALWWIS